MLITQLSEDGATVIRAEVPGVDPDEDVEISVERGVLTVSAEQHESKSEDIEGRKRSSVRHGTFRHSVSLPSDADEENITATYEDGVLEVRVPKTEGPSSGGRKIQIEKK